MEFSTFFQKYLIRQKIFFYTRISNRSLVKFGLIESVARNYGYVGSFENIRLEEAKEIYRKKFWKPLRLDEVRNERLRIILFEAGIICGNDNAIKFLKSGLNSIALYRLEKGKDKKPTFPWRLVLIDGKFSDKAVDVLGVVLRKSDKSFYINGGDEINFSEGFNNPSRLVSFIHGEVVHYVSKKPMKNFNLVNWSDFHRRFYE